MVQRDSGGKKVFGKDSEFASVALRGASKEVRTRQQPLRQGLAPEKKSNASSAGEQAPTKKSESAGT